VSHPDDERLAAAALGESLAAADAEHLRSCPQCTDEVAALWRLTELVGDPHVLVAPPPEVWRGISAGLARGAADDRGGAAGATATASTVGTSTVGTEVTPLPSPDRRHAVPGRRRSGRRWAVGLAAAAVGLIVGVAAVLGWQRVVAPNLDEVASAVLAPLPDKNGAGTAQLERSTDGQSLTVDLSSAPTASGFLEVWLLAPDAKKMVALGSLSGARTTFPVPRGLDVAHYPVVDISDEPFDGNALHSGDSILRGKLDVG